MGRTRNGVRAHGYEPEADRCFAEAERLDAAEPRWPYFRALFAGVNQPERVVEHLRHALAAASAAPAPAGAADALPTIRLRLAEALVEQQALSDAEALFRQELSRSPHNPRARFGLAQLALLRGDRRAARDAFVTLTDDPFARKRAASQASALARADGDLPTALRFQEVVRHAADDPSWPDPYLYQLRTREVGQAGLLREVTVLEASGQLRTATGLLLSLVDVDPKPRLLVSAGINLAKLRDFPRAEALLRECLRQEPANAQANYFLCVVLFEQAGPAQRRPPAETRPQLLEAVKVGRAAVAAKPDHGLAWLYLGRALLGVGEPADAVEAPSQAVACRPEMADPHLYLGEALAAVGKRQEAVASARNAEKLAMSGDPRPRQLLDRLEGPKK